MLLTLNFVHLIIKNKDKTKYLVYLVAIAFRPIFHFVWLHLILHCFPKQSVHKLFLLSSHFLGEKRAKKIKTLKYQHQGKFWLFKYTHRHIHVEIAL